MCATAGTWPLSAQAMSDGDSPALPRRPRRAAAWLAGVAADNAAGAGYGTVMVGVLLAAEWATAVCIVALEVAAAWRGGCAAWTCGFRVAPVRSWGWRSSC